jgi:hypothetical protein
MHTTEDVRLTSTRNIFSGMADLTMRAASAYLTPQMIWLPPLDTHLASTASKPLNNTLASGMKTSMHNSVGPCSMSSLLLLTNLSGNFMFNHYREALKIIKANTAELAVVNGQLGLCTADYHRFLDEERKYLHGLKKEPEEDVLRFEYVAALEDLSNMT